MNNKTVAVVLVIASILIGIATFRIIGKNANDPSTKIESNVTVPNPLSTMPSVSNSEDDDIEDSEDDD